MGRAGRETRMQGRKRTAPFVALVLALAVATAAVSPAGAGVLDQVKQRKMLACGVDPGLLGFATLDPAGVWHGLDVDYCRALAAAVLGDASLVKFVPLTERERFKALQSGAVDVLIRDTAWTMGRDTSFGMVFAGVNYYGGVGFMAPKSLGVDSALQLTGANVCVETGTATEIVVAQYFKTRGMTVNAVPVENEDHERAAYVSGTCNVMTGDTIELYGARLALPKPDDNMVLPEIVSKNAYGPAVLAGDWRWAAVVRWVHFALVDAEELGITSANVDQLRTSDDPDIRQFLGVDGSLGRAVGLDNAWAANAVRAVGNYGEVFDRNLGAGSSLQIPRGLNALWTNSGIQYAPPLR
jgi:general L-amino acid transport system substrate-binding protein